MKGKFSCPHRGLDEIDPQFIELLRQIEDEIKQDLYATNMVRCPECNAEVGGEKKSAHMIEVHSNRLCCAVDFLVDASSLPPVLRAAQRVGITRIGIKRPSGKEGFIHLDIGKESDGFIQDRIWTYA